MIGAGTWVVMERLPDWVTRLPESSQLVFRFCVGKAYRVDEIDEQGLCVVDVSRDVDETFGGYKNDLRVEAALLRPLTLGEAQSMRRGEERRKRRAF